MRPWSPQSQVPFGVSGGIGQGGSSGKVAHQPGRRAWRARSRRSRQGKVEFAEPHPCVGDHCAEVSDSGTKVKCVPKGTELGAGGGWFPRPTEENERQVQKGGLHVRGLPEGGSPNSLTSMAPQDTPLGIKIILRNGGYRRSSKN